MNAITYEEFLAHPDVPAHAEWVDGEVIPLSPQSDEHQDILGFLDGLLRLFVEAYDLGILRPAPFQMKTGPDLPGREPDLLFVAKENLHRLRKNHVAGPADMAVEIVSPDSRTRDRRDKLDEYERGGVREYWLIDPIRKEARFLALADSGYVTIPIEGGVFRSRVLPGLWLRVEWLWARPPLMSVLKEWELI